MLQREGFLFISKNLKRIDDVKHDTTSTESAVSTASNLGHFVPCETNISLSLEDKQFSQTWELLRHLYCKSCRFFWNRSHHKTTGSFSSDTDRSKDVRQCQVQSEEESCREKFCFVRDLDRKIRSIITKLLQIKICKKCEQKKDIILHPTT